jgi:hypothetical protein
MRSVFPLTYDRVDVLMSAGCSTLVSAAAILIVPRVGIILLEMLVGLLFIGCAVVARFRLRRARSAEESLEQTTRSRPRIRSFDRYDLLLIAIAILTYLVLPVLLGRTGLSPGTIHILPLVILGLGILLKPRMRQFVTLINTRKDTGKEAVNHASERN